MRDVLQHCFWRPLDERFASDAISAAEKAYGLATFARRTIAAAPLHDGSATRKCWVDK